MNGARLLLVSAIGIAVAIAGAVGAVAIPIPDVLAIVASSLGVPVDITAVDPMHVGVLLAIRMPRIVLALGVGAALGAAGATLQAVFRNPLADPGILGTSSGAAVGAAAAIVGIGTFDIVGVASWGIPLGSAIGAAVATAAAWILGSGGPDRTTRLVLSGVAINALAGALLGLASWIADEAALRNLTLWLLGSLAGATHERARIVLAVTAIGLALLLPLTRRLDVLQLGEDEAGHAGLDVRATQARALAGAALVTAGAVVFTGIIGFVGLVVPHLLRAWLGPSMRAVLPASALAGALLLLVADTIARTVAAPVELPVGVITSLVGAPFLLWIVARPRTPARARRRSYEATALPRAHRSGIAFRDVVIRFGDRTVLHAPRLDLRPGELTVLVGPNGAGKSTLLRAACGDLVIAEGDVRLGERPLARFAWQELARLRVFLPQHPALRTAFTVDEAIELGLPDGPDGPDRRHRVHLAATAAGVPHLLGRPYPSLSGGERQRVQFARILAQADASPPGADWIFLDEPTSALDPCHAWALLAHLRDQTTNGRGVVVVLHDLALAATFADRLLVIDDGRIVADGAVHDVLTPTLLERVFRVRARVHSDPDSGRTVPVVHGLLNPVEKPA